MGKKKKGILKKWWFWVIAVVIVVGALSSGGDKTDEGDKGSKTDTEVVKQEENKEEVKETEEEVAIYTIGESFATGDIGVVIEAVEEKTEFVSENQFIESVTTEGKFIAVTAKLTNNDKEARMFSSTQFKLIDEQDREFETLTSVELMMILGDNDLFLESVNPGMSRTGVFVFEVPADVEAYSLKVLSGTGFAATGSETVKLK